MKYQSFLIEVPESFYELDELSKKFLVDTLRNFCNSAVKKFIEGQKEHGGIIYNRPMLPELFKEQIDSMFYHSGAVVRMERGEKEI